MFNKRNRKPKVVLPETIEDPLPDICRKKQKTDKTSEPLFSYSEEKGLKSYGDGGATSLSEKEHDTIQEALKQKDLSAKIFTGELESEVYRGKKGYALYVEKSDASIYASKYTGSLGPIKAPNNVRATCRFDYSYGLCKDWRISGYCGYGESCIFVHDRTEFKTGWELEKEWEQQQEEKRKKAFESKSDSEESDKKSEPEEKAGCGICGAAQEVVTQCKHEFCYSCCMKQFSKTPKCYVCGKDTKGIFNEIRVSEKKNKS